MQKNVQQALPVYFFTSPPPPPKSTNQKKVRGPLKSTTQRLNRASIDVYGSRRPCSWNFHVITPEDLPT